MQYIVHSIVEYSVHYSEQYIIKEKNIEVKLKQLANHLKFSGLYDS